MKRGAEGGTGAAGDRTATPVSPFVPGWKALRRAFVNHGVKTPCKYPSFINMTWSSRAKCKEAYLQAWGAEREEGGGRGSHKVIWQFISSWAWLAVCEPQESKWIY